jgi:hypothetical protein
MMLLEQFYRYLSTLTLRHGVMGILPYSILRITWLIAILGVVGIAAFHPFLLSKHNFSGM